MPCEASPSAITNPFQMAAKDEAPSVAAAKSAPMFNLGDLQAGAKSLSRTNVPAPSKAEVRRVKCCVRAECGSPRLCVHVCAGREVGWPME